MLRIVFLLICLHYAGLSNAQDKKAQSAADIYLDQEYIVAPPIYFMTKNHYHFISADKIDSIRIQSPHDFQLTKELNNEYVIARKPMPMDEYKGANEVWLNIFFATGKNRILVIPVKFVADVTIDFISETQGLLTLSKDSVYTVEKFHCYAHWKYPPYAEASVSRFRGAFDIIVMHQGLRFASSTGWYDAGDRTRIIDLGTLPPGTEVEVVIGQYRTFMYDGYANAIRYPKVSLASDTPERIRMRTPVK